MGLLENSWPSGGRRINSFGVLEAMAATSCTCEVRPNDEPLGGEVFLSLKEAKLIIEPWHKHYNTVRLHSAFGYRPPAPKTFAPMTTHLDEILTIGLG